ncbi:MAG: lysine exporter LysO family protein [Sphaerochaeta sp.]
MDTVLYLAKLALALVLGSGFSKLIGKERLLRTTAVGQTVLVWILLFFMGINTGQIENIERELATIGLSALVLTLFSLAGSIIVALLGSKLFLPKEIDSSIAIARRKEGSLLRYGWDILKEPLFLVSIVVVGILFGVNSSLFGWFNSSYVTYLLYVMLFLVGMNLIQRSISFGAVFRDPSIFLLPLYTILGTYLGAFGASLVTSFTFKEVAGMLSGFGWYSLSGILISDLGYPVLGSISFLSNLMRESFSFFLIPLFGRLGRRYYYPAASCGGATTMDVVLVLLSKNFGSATMVGSIFHGSALSLSAPLLIPLFF